MRECDLSPTKQILMERLREGPLTFVQWENMGFAPLALKVHVNHLRRMGFTIKCSPKAAKRGKGGGAGHLPSQYTIG